MYNIEMGLKKFLDNNKIFKLVCGAGNECCEDVEKLTALYSKAGAQFFDICAKPDILKSAKEGLKISGINENRFICVSVGMKGDPHISKAYINKSKCSECGACEVVCQNNAISGYKIDEKRCIGCGKCVKVCPINAIETKESELDLNEVLPELVSMGIDCIELHATSDIDSDIWEKWDAINRHFSGMVSICLDRLNLGNKQIKARLDKMLKSRKPYTTIIQADGIPMSGSDNTYKTTLQAVAMAEIIQDLELPVYILISGGTNGKTVQLANMCDLRYDGVAIGSYARKIVKPYINRADFYAKEVFEESLKLAKELVRTV